MTLTMKQMTLLTSFFGEISFVCGVIAENKKPAAGTPIPGKGVVICKYPSDRMVSLGFISSVALCQYLIHTTGSMSHIPLVPKQSHACVLQHCLVNSRASWRNAHMANNNRESETLHWTRNIHYNIDYKWPTAKTGLTGGGAFVSLDSCVFWLICLVLAGNIAREDYLNEVEETRKGEWSQIIDVDGDMKHSTSA